MTKRKEGGKGKGKEDEDVGTSLLNFKMRPTSRLCICKGKEKGRGGPDATTARLTSGCGAPWAISLLHSGGEGERKEKGGEKEKRVGPNPPRRQHLSALCQ